MMQRFMRLFAFLCLPLCLAGCGLPTPVSIATWALDGISYVASGKSISDHAMSMATGQDCVMLRFVEGEEVCRDFEDGKKPMLVAEAQAWAVEQRRIAAADAWTQTDPELGLQRSYAPTAIAARDVPAVEPVALGAAPTPKAKPVEVAAPLERRFVQVSFEPRSTSADLALLPPAALAPDQRLLVIGSFARQANAERLAERWSRFAVSIVPAQADGRRVYRVVTEPLAVEEIAAARARLTGAGIAASWSVRLCTAHWHRPDCVDWPAASES